MNKAQIIWLIVMISFVVLIVFMEINFYMKFIGFALSLLIWVVFDNIFMNVF